MNPIDPFKKVCPQVKEQSLNTALNQSIDDIGHGSNQKGTSMDQSQNRLQTEGLETDLLDSEQDIRDRHILIIHDGQGRHKVDLSNSVYSVGRSPECDIELSSQFASRHHATFLYMPFSEREDCCYCIVDGNLKGDASTNGLFVNGKKIKAQDLKDGDELIFGPDARASYHRLVVVEDNNKPINLEEVDLDETVANNIFNCLEGSDAEIAA
ncbi:MAG: FHA domain-containing protein [Leptolyngbyaceae cyanobacterium]